MTVASKSLNRPSDTSRTREFATLSDELESFAVRFCAPARREVRRLIRSSPRLADLATVFPGVVHALAMRRGAAGARLDALALIEQGAPLKIVARALDLPFWLRRLPPEAFQEPVGQLPSSETFSRRIAARLPAAASESAFWLSTVAFAAKACHEDFALWLAEQPIYSEPGEPERLFAVLAAYAWFSGAALSRGHGLIVVPWRPEIAFDTALCAAKSWFNRVRLVLQLDVGVITDTWFAPGQAMGYTFVPLIDHGAILAEAHAMQNCADQYAERLSLDKCRLFSVRRNGARVATLEIGLHPREAGVLTITQLKARHNIAAPIEVWQAAHAWLAAQTGLKRLPSLAPPDRPLDDRVWQAVTRPYRQKTDGAPWFTGTASPEAFAALDTGLIELARRSGVSSWLFT